MAHVGSPPADLQWAYDKLARVDQRAREILTETGFGAYASADHGESDDAWDALQRALAHRPDPRSAGVRARRALASRLLVREIHLDFERHNLAGLFRRAFDLGALSDDVLSHAEYAAVIVPRQRRRGQQAAAAHKRAERAERLGEWRAEAARVRAEHPSASATVVAREVARICEANLETVRKALRRPARRRTRP
jgi:hypothetical protein